MTSRLVGVLIIGSFFAPVSEAGEIKAVVNFRGKVVYTNVAERVAPEALPAASAPAVRRDRGTWMVGRTRMPEQISELMHSIAADHGVDPNLVGAVMHTESAFNPNAVSVKGALGLMQLIPATGARFGVRDFFDPRQNIEGGVRYLRFLLEKFDGNLDLSLAAYNAGENLVERLGRVPSIPETRNYVRKIRSIYRSPGPVSTGGTGAAEAAKKPGGIIAGPQAPEPPKIFRTVDVRGVAHFSNVEPPK